jgi:hypothetical protein
MRSHCHGKYVVHHGFERRMRFEGTVDALTSIRLLGVARDFTHVILLRPKCDPQTFAFIQSTGLWTVSNFHINWILLGRFKLPLLIYLRYTTQHNILHHSFSTASGWILWMWGSIQYALRIRKLSSWHLNLYQKSSNFVLHKPFSLYVYYDMQTCFRILHLC